MGGVAIPKKPTLSLRREGFNVIVNFEETNFYEIFVLLGENEEARLLTQSERFEFVSFSLLESNIEQIVIKAIELQ